MSIPAGIAGAETIAALERTAAIDVGRGSEILAAHNSGSLLRAATALMSGASVRALIVTGFFIAAADPPACETDGPIGAAQLAAALTIVGAQARILTDAPCERVVRAAIVAAGVEVPLDVAPLPGEVGPVAYAQWEAEILAAHRPVTHAISIERAGPGRDGVPRTMRGVDISAHTAPLDRIYDRPGRTRIAIGDGGNELGMGLLPAELVTAAVPRGAEIHCLVDCDVLIVAGTSNWGAAALVAALSVLDSHGSGHPDRQQDLQALLRPQWSHHVLTWIVERAGAVDGVLGSPAIGVDGLAWSRYAETLRLIAELVRH